MDGRDSGNRKRIGSVKSASNLYGGRMFESYSPLKKPLRDVSEEPSPRKREPHSARRDNSLFRESTKNAEAAKAEAESELCGAKKTVKDLALRIEVSNSRVKKIEELEKQKKPKMRQDDLGSSQRNTQDDQYAEVIGELEYVKEELSKLKVDMAFVLEEKWQAEKETEASSSKILSYSSSVEAFRKEIDELNEEHVIVELARIEALREYGAIEVRRKEEAKQYSFTLEGTRKKMNDLIEETDSAKGLQMKLALTTSDVNLLKNELAIVKADTRKQESLNHPEGSSTKGELESPSFLHSVSEELEAAKKELASITEEGFHFISSMEIIRDEVKHLVEEITRLRKTEEKADLTIQSLNSKLLRAKTKLEGVSAAEEKATSISSSLAVTLEQLKTEVEAARRERELIHEDTAKIKAEIPKTESEIDLAEAKLEATIQELTAVKSSEAMALENLKTIVENSMRTRASASQHSSTITISTFEYEYLQGRAAGAEELADKKVAAAQAWIEALKASEEILMKTEINQREIRELRVEEERKVHRTEQIICAKRLPEEEVWNLGKKHDKISKSEKLQLEIASPRKHINRNGISAAGRRPKFRKSASPAVAQLSRSTSVTVDRRRKGVPNLAKFFSSKNIEKDHQIVGHKHSHYLPKNELVE